MPPTRPVPRLLACDLDGTLQGPDGRLSPTVTATVDALRQIGVRVVLATGRSPWAMASACRELGFHEPQITMQGGFIASPLGGAVMRARTLRADEVLDHLDFARLIGLTPVVTFPDGHRAERWPRGVARLNGAALAESLRFELVPSLEAIAGRGAIRTFIPTPPRRHAEVRDLARDWFGPRASVVWTDHNGIELLASGTNKGEALGYLARKMGLDLERDVAAIGDGPNDVEMLRVAGRSVALGSAPADVKAAAGQVVPAEAPDGAVQAIGLLFPALVEPTRRTSPLPDLHGSEVGAR